MGRLTVHVPFNVGDLVFAAGVDEHQYTCECAMCSGYGTLKIPEGTKVIGAEEEEGDWLADDEAECPACEGYGSDDEEVEILFPCLVGRISRITADVTADLDEESPDEYEEVMVGIRHLAVANLDGESEMSMTEQMIRFYHALKAGEIMDFNTVVKGSPTTVRVDRIHKTYKQLCEYVLKENLETFKKIHEDLTNQEYEIPTVDRMGAIHVCNEIVAIQDMILGIYPELAKLTPGYKAKGKKTNKKTEGKTEKKPNEALMALSSVEVEEALF